MADPSLRRLTFLLEGGGYRLEAASLAKPLARYAKLGRDGEAALARNAVGRAKEICKSDSAVALRSVAFLRDETTRALGDWGFAPPSETAAQAAQAASATLDAVKAAKEKSGADAEALETKARGAAVERARVAGAARKASLASADARIDAVKKAAVRGAKAADAAVKGAVGKSDAAAAPLTEARAEVREAAKALAARVNASAEARGLLEADVRGQLAASAARESERRRSNAMEMRALQEEAARAVASVRDASRRLDALTVRRVRRNLATGQPKVEAGLERSAAALEALDAGLDYRRRRMPAFPTTASSSGDRGAIWAAPEKRAAALAEEVEALLSRLPSP